MWFYAFEELSDGAYTLGRVMYAPEGDWGKAAETSPGDYDQMTYEIDFKQKDWSQRPSQEEVEIYKTWDYILYDYYDEHEDQEDVITDMTAEELGIGVEEVDRAVNNVSNWSMMGTFDDASENGIPDEFEEPAKEDKIEVELNVNHEISQDRTVQIVVETNLPDGIELSVGLSNDEIDYVAGDGVELSDGRAESAWFSDDGEALESGTYEVRVGTRYPHTQPDYVQEIIGEGGQNLTGEYVEEDDFGKTASKTKRIHINNN